MVGEGVDSGDLNAGVTRFRVSDKVTRSDVINVG